MTSFIDIQAITDALKGVQQWLFDNMLVASSLVQLLVILGLFALAWLTAPRLKKRLVRVLEDENRHLRLRQAVGVLEPLALPVLWLPMQWLAVRVAVQAGWSHHIMVVVVSLLAAWVAIRLLASFISDPVWSRTLSVSVWTVAALNIVGLLGPATDLLDSLALSVGTFRLSVLGLAKGILLLVVFLWLADMVSKLAEKRLGAVMTVSPTVQVLMGKMLRFALYTLAILVGLNSVGIDLTALAVFSGAVGLGIGFGLQKVFSNLISGVILLLDKSVKPGDVIAVGDTYGWINTLSARYVSLITRDGTEHLIPNEELISQQVENWSFSSNNVRLRLPLGISYRSDPHQAIVLCKEVAKENERVLAKPEPNCLVRSFGDSSVDLELRVWIKDPSNGIGNIKSNLYLGIWDKFKENGIEIPFPQRDVHLNTSAPVSVKVINTDCP